jgi:hypothetical protein
MYMGFFLFLSEIHYLIRYLEFPSIWNCNGIGFHIQFYAAYCYQLYILIPIGLVRFQ